MNERIAYCIDQELQNARHKFPMPNKTFRALVEEVGELAKAMLDFDIAYQAEENLAAARLEVFSEAIQVATMAIRVAEEGDSESTYSYSYECYRDFGK